MSKFEKELDGILEIIKDEKFYNSKLYALPSIEELKTHFKDWQPPKPLVVVPQFFADWFENQLKNNESKKFDGNDVFRIIQDVIKVSNGESTWDDYGITDEIAKFAEDNEELFLNLIVNCSVGNGYMVKKEPLYALEFPKQLNSFVAYTVKNQDDEVIISGYTTIKKGAKRFTEQEIKAIDPRYFDFAVKVEVDK